MGKVIRCANCNSFYNASIYPEGCPYCRDEHSDNAEKKTGKIDKTESGKWGFWKKKKKNELEGQSSDKSQQSPYKQQESYEQKIPDEQPKPDEQPQRNAVIEHVGRTVPLTPDVPVQKCPVIVPIAEDSGSVQAVSKEESDNKSGLTLSQAISRSGRTIGKYISDSSGESISPVTGWLVAVKGAYFGRSFELNSGKNRIGRSHDMDVKLLNEESVSRTSAAVIIFDSKVQEFSILPGESDWLCYVNDKAVYERVILKGYEEIEFGDSGLNKYIFIPFCNERFQWDTYSSKQRL